MLYTSLLSLPPDRGTEKETEQFPLVIKYVNIKNPQARSCIAHSGHVSAPPGFRPVVQNARIRDFIHTAEVQPEELAY